MKTLIWKEWREQQLFFLISIIVIALSGVVITLPLLFSPRLLLIWELRCLLFLFFSAFFSLGLPLTSFTSDFNKKTLDFQLSNPVSSARIFWVKFLFNLILLFILVFLAKLFLKVPADNLARLFLESTQPNLLRNFFAITILVTSILVLYSTACFNSLLLKNALIAGMCIPFIIIFGCILLGAAFIGIYAMFETEHFVIIGLLFLLILLISSSFFLWQKVISKKGSLGKTLTIISFAAICCSLIIHGICTLTADARLKKTLAETERAGFKLNYEQVIPPPVKDEDNAAFVYHEAFELADKLKERYTTEWAYMPYESKIPVEKLTTEQKRTISKIMKDPEFIKFYGLIEQAVNMPACRFDINYEEAPDISLLHLGKIRMLARLIAAKTYILYEEKQFQEAFQLAKTGLLLENALVKEPIFISQLVRIAADEIAIDSFQQLLNSSTIIHIKNYQNLIKVIDNKEKYIVKALEGEAAIFGLWILKRDHGYDTTYLPNLYRNSIVRFLAKPLIKNDCAFYIQETMKLLNFLNQPYYSIKDSLIAWENNITPEATFPPKHVLARMLMPAYSRLIILQANYQATLDTLKFALALKIYKEKHGNYPNTLSPLAPEIIKELPLDPFTGKDYIYRKEGKGFIICSVGSNEKDDNGLTNSIQNYDDISFKVTN